VLVLVLVLLVLVLMLLMLLWLPALLRNKACDTEKCWDPDRPRFPCAWIMRFSVRQM